MAVLSRSDLLLSLFLVIDLLPLSLILLLFFLNDTATPEIYPLPLHDPLPISPVPTIGTSGNAALTCHTHRTATGLMAGPDRPPYRPASTGRMVAGSMTMPSSVLISDRRSEEHTSELQSRSDLVCRLLLEKKKQ